MHSHLLEGLGEAREVRLAEDPCEGPSAVRRFVTLVASPYLAVGCEPSVDLGLHVEQI